MSVFKTVGCFILAAFFAISWAPFSSAELSEGKKDTIFVGRIQIQPSIQDKAQQQNRTTELNRVSDSLDTQLSAAPSATRVFELVERKRKSDLELEQAFASVAVDPNDANAAKTLKMAGAKYVLLPEIDGFEDFSDTQIHQAIGRVSSKRTVDLSATVKIVDTTTGKLLPDVPSIQLEKIDSIEVQQLGTNLVKDRVFVEIAKEMANRLSQEVIGFLRPAKVLAVTGSQFLINRGSPSGFVSGEKVEFYTTEDVKDKDTGEVYKNEAVVGQGVVLRSDVKQSFAKADGENLGITVGTTVRIQKAQTAVGDAGTSLPAPQELTPGSSEKPLKLE